MATFNTVFGSTLPSGAIDFITQDFNVTDPVQFALPISIYLVGYIPGPLLLSPLSEAYGRRVIMVSSFALFTIFTVACALAPNWPSFLFFRLVCGISAFSSIAITVGIFGDIFADPVALDRAFAMYTTVRLFFCFLVLTEVVFVPYPKPSTLTSS